LRRQLTRQIGGTGVRMGRAAMSASDAEFRLSAGHFVVRGIQSELLVEPNLPQLARSNKTVGLVAWEGADGDGD
jgi:hypothetical protein